MKTKQIKILKEEIDEKYNYLPSQKYFVVGRKLSKKYVEELGLPWEKAGPGEVWIEVPKILIDEMQK